uniref:HDC06176 n=1 Tax=Drosophila melanogaster TaxID=7227 RepID=Q6IGJ7_DROME|nr:TPA_inf: HDC06176 [Drosophila melanogaster]
MENPSPGVWHPNAPVARPLSPHPSSNPMLVGPSLKVKLSTLTWPDRQPRNTECVCGPKMQLFHCHNWQCGSHCAAIAAPLPTATVRLRQPEVVNMHAKTCSLDPGPTSR